MSDTPNINTFQTSTNTSNVDGGNTATCGPGQGGYPLQPLNTGAVALDLLAQRWLNLQQCDYFFAAGNDHFTQFVPDTPNQNLYLTDTSTSNDPTSVARPAAPATRWPMPSARPSRAWPRWTRWSTAT